MTREQQTQVRQMSERLMERMSDDRSTVEHEWEVVALLEVARQISLLTEQVVRLNKKVDRLTPPDAEWGSMGDR